MAFASPRRARLDPPFTEADWVKAGCARVEIAPCPGLGPPFDWADLLDEHGEIMSPDDFRLLKTWWGGEVYEGGTYLGLNAMRCYLYEASVDGTLDPTRQSRKYGNISAILQDCHEVGAQFLRQTDIADLTWGQNGGLVPYERADIDAVLEPGRIALTNLLTRAALQHQKVVLTFLTAGTGAYVKQTSGWADDASTGNWPTDPKAEIGAGLAWFPFDYALHQGQLDPVDHRYHPEHVRFEGDISAFLPDEEDWYFSSLDPRSPYKRAFIRVIAQRAARLLLSMEPSLLRQILAIELFNEVDHKNSFNGPTFPRASTKNATGWAELIVAAMKGFVDVFGVSAAGCPVRFWLPSLASHTDPFKFAANDGSERQVSLMKFHQTLLSEVGQGLSDEGIDTTLIVNQDYHFYHFDDPDRKTRDGIPISRLRDELQFLLSNRTAEWAHLTMSVCETGSSLASNPPGSRPPASPRVSSDYVYALDAVARYDTATLDRFQAREVWRRLAGAMAAGAAYTGWNSMIATPDGFFDRCGLREDSGDDRTALSVDAHKRLSWWAFRRVRELLLPTKPGSGYFGGGAVGEFYYPALTPLGIYDFAGEQVIPFTSKSDVMDYLVILHFTSGSQGPHTYVVFLDPTVGLNVAVDVQYGPSDFSSIWVTIYPSIPISTQNTHVGVLGGRGTPELLPGDLPQDAADWANPITYWVSPRESLTLTGDQDPYVLVSQVPLVFETPSGMPISRSSDQSERLRRLRRLGRRPDAP